ncbi:FKBP-type peptidyl-prolyl cis-trans isomerase [Solitalea lacus]|uniref:FKBP-type peptidyl-prolyl cis-trans isomerase n=1 Tax=Solitalea lacus TaxID=2911172 RepID=UPI001EDA093B|nr:FKBP-type peptidyl-prolyl cis-trans isomerase [Solitalea lacus]UKJ08348.1 FKBP-type peptidyl-prolyl cis-trans isomerase [Solitalea lacus]
MMSVKKIAAVLVAASLSSIAFTTGFLQTKRGLYYKILKTSTSPQKVKIKQGDYVKFHLVYKTDKDSVLQSTYKLKQPIETTVKLDTLMDKAQVMDALTLLAKGDSATFKISSAHLFKGAPTDAQRPSFLGANRFLCYTIKVIDVKTPQQLAAEAKAAAAKRKATEDKAIADYALTNKLLLKNTISGLRYSILNIGEGEKAKAGDTISVHYTGKLLNGKKFDSSYDRNQPIEFVVGQKMVIAGWDEGLQLLKKGEKAILVIPSGLAYGERAMGADIPANSILAFDVELIDIKPKK